MTSCAICHTRMAPWLYQPLDPKKNKRSAFDRFVRCENCGLGVMADMPTPDEVVQFYALEAYYTQGESHIAYIEPTVLDRVLTKIAYLGDRAKSPTVQSLRAMLPEDARTLDVGCGSGKIVNEFAALGCEAFGLEPDASAISQAKPNIFQGLAEELPAPFENRKFDLISITHVLEHCIDPIKVTSNIFSMLKPGGVIWCEVPNCDSIHFEALNICSEMFDAPRHIYFFGRDSLEKTVGGAAFEAMEFYYRGFARHHSPTCRAW